MVQHYNAARGDILEDEDAERAQAAAYGSAEAAGGGNGDSGGEQCLPQQQRWQAFKDEGDEVRPGIHRLAPLCYAPLHV